MARQRLGVVLLVPHPIATQVDGIRRALGDGALGRIEAHLTLVPPVNVAERDLTKAFAIVRAAAATVEPLALRLMRAIGVQVLVIDEVHNILAGSYREQRVVLNTLRFLSNEGPSHICLNQIMPGRSTER